MVTHAVIRTRDSPRVCSSSAARHTRTERANGVTLSDNPGGAVVGAVSLRPLRARWETKHTANYFLTAPLSTGASSEGKGDADHRVRGKMFSS